LATMKPETLKDYVVGKVRWPVTSPNSPIRPFTLVHALPFTET